MPRIKAWKSLAVIVGFPIVYILYVLSPVGSKLFVEKEIDYYIPFWIGIVLLHWLSVFIVMKMLYAHGQNLKEIGYKLSRRGALYLVGVYVLIAIAVLSFTECMLKDVELSQEALKSIRGLTPKTTLQRVFFILVVFSTGFCEEIVYRGFAITQLKQIGINKWLAITIASFCFVGIHGLNGYLYRFPFLFVGGIVFGVIFILSKRLLPSMLIHLAINLSAMMVILQLLE